MNNTQKNVLSWFKGTEITRNAALVKPKVGNGTRVNMTYFALGCFLQHFIKKTVHTKFSKPVLI